MNKEQLHRYLLEEYTNLSKYCTTLIKGIYVTPSENVTIWNGVLFVRSGLYKNGIFKFNLEFSENYPFEAPTLYFQAAINHPMVSLIQISNFLQIEENGEVILTSLHKSLKPMKQNIALYTLVYLKSIFYQEEEEYEGDMTVAECIQLSHQVLFQQDENFLKFKPLQSEEYNKLVQTLQKESLGKLRKMNKTTIVSDL